MRRPVFSGIIQHSCWSLSCAAESSATAWLETGFKSICTCITDAFDKDRCSSAEPSAPPSLEAAVNSIDSFMAGAWDTVRCGFSRHRVIFEGNSSAVYFRRISQALKGIRARSISGEFHRKPRFPHLAGVKIKQGSMCAEALTGIRARSISGEFHRKPRFPHLCRCQNKTGLNVCRGSDGNSSSVYSRKFSHSTVDFAHEPAFGNISDACRL